MPFSTDSFGFHASDITELSPAPNAALNGNEVPPDPGRVRLARPSPLLIETLVMLRFTPLYVPGSTNASARNI